MTALAHDTQPALASAVLERVLVGIDGSPESIEAARQAARLLEPGGRLTLLAAWTLPAAIIGPTGPVEPYSFDDEAQRTHAFETLEDARAVLPPALAVSDVITHGTAWLELVRTATAADDTLVAVGSHGMGRVRGIMFGSTATEVVHHAPCSVLVSRKATDGFPRKIVVGVDGSPQSAAAYEVARAIATRVDAELWPVVSHGGKAVDRDAVHALLGPHHEDLQGEPVDALLAAAADADLVVVGSRGLHGWRALGSVSERIAHQAHCSTLIVRGPETGTTPVEA